MNAEVLLKHFDSISDAAEAIPRLRQFILELAVRGKLVDQVHGDSPASHLVKQIQEEKRTRTHERETRNPPPRPIEPTEEWFEIPHSWCWVRLAEIADILMGQSPPGETYNKSGEGIPLINGPVEFTEGPFGRTVVNQYTTSPTNICEEGDLLLCVRGSTTGRTNIAAFRACIGRGVAAIRPHFDGQYVRLFIWRLRASIIAMGRGIAFPSVNRQQIADLVIPLPPLPEQARIVAKVDELMALCDRLEEAQKQRESRRDRLTAATLKSLNSAGDQDSVRENARFFIDNISRFTARPNQIKSIRQTILDLAVRGSLVEQEREHDAVNVLLMQIQKEREALVRQGRIRPEKPVKPIDPNEMPYAIPMNWRWVRIGQASLFTEYGTSHQSISSSTGVPVLKMGDIQDGRVLLGEKKTVPSSIDDLPALFLEKYDLLYNRTNSAELVGKTGIYLGDNNEYTFASYLIRIRCSTTASNPRFVNMAMNAPSFRSTQIVPHLKQQCGQANVNGTTLKQMLIPFPPLEEQIRIVNMVDELMLICDLLENDLNSCVMRSGALLQSVLNHALGNAVTPNGRFPRASAHSGHTHPGADYDERLPI